MTERPWLLEMKTTWRMLQSLPRVTRAQRDIRTAGKRHSQGDSLEAFRLAAPAFSSLHELALGGHPPAASILALHAPFFDEVARAAGQPDAAIEELQTALALCEDLGRSSDRMREKLAPHVEWLRSRLTDSSDSGRAQ